MPSVSLTFDPRPAEEGAKRFSKAAEVVRSSAKRAAAATKQIETQQKAEARAQREATRERDRAKRGLDALQTSLGGAERAAVKHRRAITQLNAAFKQGQVSQAEFARLQGLISKRFTQQAISARSLTGRISALGSTVRSLAGAFVLIQGVRLFAGAARDALEFGRTITQVSEKLGITTTEVQLLQKAAATTGTGFNQVQIAVQRFERRLAEARAGFGEAKDTLRGLGILARSASGDFRSAFEAFTATLEAANQLGDQERLLAFFKLFDSEGVAAISAVSEEVLRLNGNLPELERLLGQGQVNALAAADEAWNNLTEQVKEFAREAAGAAALALGFGNLDPLTRARQALEELADVQRKIRESAEATAAAGGGVVGSFAGFFASGKTDLKLVQELSDAEKEFADATDELAKSIRGETAEEEKRNKVRQQAAAAQRAAREFEARQTAEKARAGKVADIRAEIEFTEKLIRAEKLEGKARLEAIAIIEVERKARAQNLEGYEGEISALQALEAELKSIRDTRADEAKALAAASKAAEKAAAQAKKDAAKAATVASNEQIRIFERTQDRIAVGLSDAFVSAFQIGKDEAFDFAEFFTELMRTTAEEVARLLIFKPIVEGVTGGVTSLFSGGGGVGTAEIAQAGAQAGGVAGGGAAGTTSFLGGSLGSLGTGITLGGLLAPLSLIGQNSPLSANAVGGAQLVGNASAIGAGVGAATGLAAGGIIGGAALGGTLGSAVPVVGTIVGAVVGALAGLIGGEAANRPGRTKFRPQIGFGAPGDFDPRVDPRELELENLFLSLGPDSQRSINLANDLTDGLTDFINSVFRAVDGTADTLVANALVANGISGFGARSVSPKQTTFALRSVAETTIGALGGTPDFLKTVNKFNEEDAKRFGEFLDFVSTLDTNLARVTGTGTQVSEAFLTLDRTFQETISSAERFGIATDRITQAFEIGRERIGLDIGLENELALLGGSNPLAAALIEFERNIGQQRIREAEAAGLDLLAFERRNAEDRQAIADQINSPFSRLLSQLQTGSLGGLSTTDRLSNARTALDELISGGGTPGELAAAFQAVVELSRQVNASGTAFQEDRLAAIEGLEGLIQAFDPDAAFGGLLDATDTQTDVLSSDLRAILARLESIESQISDAALQAAVAP